MSWKEILLKFDGHEKSIQQIVETYNGTIELMQTVMKDIEEFVPLLEGNMEAAELKWKEMKGGILDVEGSFGALTDIHEYISRLLSEA